MIYALFIYTRAGACLYQEKWNVAATKAVAYADPGEEMRLLFGLLFSLKEFVSKTAPTPAAAAGSDTFGYDYHNHGGNTSTAASEGMQRFQTNTYTCHQYETPSGLRFVLTTDNHAGDLNPVLKYIYSHLYVEYVVNNPLSDVQTTKRIDNQLFRDQLKQYIEKLPCFR